MFTINGFPHGTFHGQPVKADVHAPDWRSEERVAYTLRLAEILAALLPDGVDGTISTSPLSYGPGSTATRDRGAARATSRARRATALRGTRDRARHRARGRRRAGRRSTTLIRWWPRRARPEHVTRVLRRLPLGGRLRGARGGARRARRRPASAIGKAQLVGARCAVPAVARARELRARSPTRSTCTRSPSAARTARCAVARPARGAGRRRRRRGVARALPRADLRRALRRAASRRRTTCARCIAARCARRTWRSRRTRGTCCRPT